MNNSTSVDCKQWKYLDNVDIDELKAAQVNEIMPEMNSTRTTIEDTLDDTGAIWKTCKFGINEHVPYVCNFKMKRIQKDGVDTNRVCFGPNFKPEEVCKCLNITSLHPTYPKYRYKRVPIYEDLDDCDSFKCYRLVYTTTAGRNQNVHVSGTTHASMYNAIGEPPPQRRRFG
jgi:hypothetical protein